MQSLEERGELWEFFRDDVRQLEQMLNVDLSHWEPGNAAVSTIPASDAPVVTGQLHVAD